MKISLHIFVPYVCCFTFLFLVDIRVAYTVALQGYVTLALHLEVSRFHEGEVAAVYSTRFNTHTLCISLREYICMIRIILRINRSASSTGTQRVSCEIRAEDLKIIQMNVSLHRVQPPLASRGLGGNISRESVTTALCLLSRRVITTRPEVPLPSSNTGIPATSRPFLLNAVSRTSQLLEIITPLVFLVRKRTKPTEQPPLVSELSANFCG
jgi:hypothetical protein